MWTLTHTLPGGHRLFRDEGGRTAIADESGHAPDLTDDGVLYLDSSGHRLPLLRDAASVPVVDPEGREFVTVVSPEDLLIVAETFYGGHINTANIHWHVARDHSA